MTNRNVKASSTNFLCHVWRANANLGNWAIPHSTSSCHYTGQLSFNPILPGLFLSFWAWGMGGTKCPSSPYRSRNVLTLSWWNLALYSTPLAYQIGLMTCQLWRVMTSQWRHIPASLTFKAAILNPDLQSHGWQWRHQKIYKFVLRNILTKGKKTEKRLKNKENSQNTLLSRRLLWKRQS